MDRQQIGVKLAIDGLKLPFVIDTFMDRLIMQKAVYLAQAAGVNLGYYYHWYLHGPYSPSLTRDVPRHDRRAQSVAVRPVTCNEPPRPLLSARPKKRPVYCRPSLPCPCRRALPRRVPHRRV